MRSDNSSLKQLGGFGVSVFALAIGLFSDAARADGYLCAAEQSIGLERRESGKWQQFSVSPSGKYLVVRPSSEEGDYFKKYSWIVKKIDLKVDVPLFTCAMDFDSYGAERLFCDGFGAFTMSKKNMRFQRTYDDGYVTDEGSSGIEIGSCKIL